MRKTENSTHQLRKTNPLIAALEEILMRIRVVGTQQTFGSGHSNN